MARGVSPCIGLSIFWPWGTELMKMNLFLEYFFLFFALIETMKNISSILYSIVMLAKTLGQKH